MRQRSATVSSPKAKNNKIKPLSKRRAKSLCDKPKPKYFLRKKPSPVRKSTSQQLKPKPKPKPKYKSVPKKRSISGNYKILSKKKRNIVAVANDGGSDKTIKQQRSNQIYNQPTQSQPTKPSEKWIIYSLYGCSYCEKAKQLLDSKGLEYEYIEFSNLKQDEQQQVLRKMDGEKQNFRTYPRIFRAGKFIGGFNDLTQLI